MHLMFFASQKYLETYGVPGTLANLAKHRLVMQVTDEASAKEAFESLFPGCNPRNLLMRKINVSSATTGL